MKAGAMSDEASTILADALAGAQVDARPDLPPDAIAVDEPAAAADYPFAAPGAVYEAASPWGPLQLALVLPAPPAHAAQALLQLALLERWLAPLDAWLAAAREVGPGDATAAGAPRASASWAGPHWRWGPDVAPLANPGGSHAVALLHGGQDQPTARLLLPWALMRQLPAPTPELRTWLSWLPAPAVCVLARPRLSAEEALQLEPGGLLLVAPSFQPGWAGWLRAEADAGGGGWPASLARPDAPQALPCAGAADTAPAPSSSRWELRRQVVAPANPAALCGWHAEPLPLADAATLWLLPEPGSAPATAPGQPPGLCVARGRLVPWGQGQALLVAACALPVAEPDDERNAAAWT